jgi:hypothetical protein
MLLISHHLHLLLGHILKDEILVLFPVALHYKLVLDPSEVCEGALGLHIIVFIEVLHSRDPILLDLLNDTLLMNFGLDQRRLSLGLGIYLELLFEILNLPLKNGGYLFRILYGLIEHVGLSNELAVLL